MTMEAAESISTPRPDPTALTTQQLVRELGALRELMESRIDVIKGVVDERFNGVSAQFIQRDIALSAALAAAKEAVTEQNRSAALAIAKSETAFTKQFDAIGELISTISKSNSEKIDDVRTRLENLEGRRSGHGESFDGVARIFALLIACGGIAIALFAHH